MDSPTLRQRQLAKKLRDLRNEAGLSIAEVAAELLCSPAKISRIETSQRRAALRDVRDLCRLYGVADPGELMDLARDAQKQAWWQETEDVDFRPLIGLELEASAITEYETTTIPGLLQTHDYAEAVIRGYLPQIEPEVLEERVQIRMKRQEVLGRDKPPVRYWVLLDESALHRHIGGRRVMAGQLAHLADLAARSNITILVVPYTAGAHMGLDSAFMLLEFDESSGQSDIVYMDTLAGQIFLEKPKQLERFREILHQLRAVALSPDESQALIRAQSEKFVRET